MSDAFTQNPSVILDKTVVDIPLMVGELPGSPEPTDNLFSGGTVAPPVDPTRVLRAALSSGGVMSVGHVVAQGTTGIAFEIVPRRSNVDIGDREKWPEGAAAQRDIMEVFRDAGFRGSGQYNIREAFYTMEHDRFLVGWGGIGVVRSSVTDQEGLPPKPIALSRFEASGARFSRPDANPTPVPVPVSLSDGRTVWVEVPRHFRRIMFRSSNGRVMWFKEYGDWRALDARTGKYSTGNRAYPPNGLGKPGKYVPGKLGNDAKPAIEVAHFRTSFPGIYPYGISGWHAELNAVDSSAEHVKLLVSYLKSGLHSVMIAAANRPFESGSAEAAVQKIDELGRGRNGLGALITIALIPQDSSGGNPMLGANQADDRGRLILHELSTKLPEALLNDTLSDALSSRIAQAERIPGLLLGRSESYNFATAAAAWATANRLRFAPHHAEHEAFLDALTAEMGVTDWRFKTVSPEWEEKEPLAGIASVSGQLGGISINRAMDLMAIVAGIDATHVNEWWGDLPLPIVSLILGSPDPQGMLDGLGIKAKFPEGKSSVNEPLVEALKSLETALKAKVEATTG